MAVESCYLLLVSIICLITAEATPNRHRHQHQGCSEPKPADLADLRRDLLDSNPVKVHPSLYGLPFFQPQEMSDQSVTTEHESSDIVIGDRACPKAINNHSDDYLERSTCPFYHVITHDSDRIPAMIVEARCKCQTCLPLMDMGRAKNTATCRRIFYYTPVLRKTGCNNDTKVFEYRRMFEPVAVGCTCVHPRLHSSRRSESRAPRPALSFIAK